MESPLSTLAHSFRHDVRVIDPTTLSAHAAWRAKGRWQGSFNFAAWIRFPEGLSEMVQLMLSLRDQERHKSYVIDRCLPNRQTLILLNGVIDLDVAGEVNDACLYLTGLPEDAVWMLDECHIEPRQAAVLERRKLSSGVSC